MIFWVKDLSHQIAIEIPKLQIWEFSKSGEVGDNDKPNISIFMNLAVSWNDFGFLK